MKTAKVVATKQRGIRVSDLRDQINVPDAREFLLCDRCFEQSSANAGDYWNAPADHVFMHCGEPMRLVEERVTFVDVLPKNEKRRRRA